MQLGGNEDVKGLEMKAGVRACTRSFSLFLPAVEVNISVFWREKSDDE